MTERLWFRVVDVAARLHVAPITAWRLVRPYRAQCHLARDGSNPRQVLWIPSRVVDELQAERGWRAKVEA